MQRAGTNHLPWLQGHLGQGSCCVPVRHHLSESCLSPAWVPCQRQSARVRWAIVFSGLRYIIIYIPRTPGRPQMFCSPVMRFCLRPDEELGPTIQPPIWSILVYMLLVETLKIDDDALRERFGLVIPMEDPDLGSKIDPRGCRRLPGMTMEVDE